MNILVTENYNRKDIFEIVDEYPHGYIVWPIGRRNFLFTRASRKANRRTLSY